MLPQGLFSPLGPLGPLGVLGPLGPIGSVALVASGYSQDSDGNLNQGGSVARTITVAGNTFELFEWYDETFAMNMQNNDASFMVRGQVNNNGDSRTFSFTSNANQYVTILVNAEAQLDSFSILLQDGSGNEITRANVDATYGLINWIQILAPAGQQFIVKIELMSTSSSPLSYHPYRLFVVGSTANIASTTVTGNMIQQWSPSGSSSDLAAVNNASTPSSSSGLGTPQLIAAIAAPLAVGLLVIVAIVLITRKRFNRAVKSDIEMHAEGSVETA